MHNDIVRAFMAIKDKAAFLADFGKPCLTTDLNDAYFYKFILKEILPLRGEMSDITFLEWINNCKEKYGTL